MMTSSKQTPGEKNRNAERNGESPESGETTPRPRKTVATVGRQLDLSRQRDGGDNARRAFSVV